MDSSGDAATGGTVISTPPSSTGLVASGSGAAGLRGELVEHAVFGRDALERRRSNGRRVVVVRTYLSLERRVEALQRDPLP
jgi:hypothetical protein